MLEPVGLEKQLSKLVKTAQYTRSHPQIRRKRASRTQPARVNFIIMARNTDTSTKLCYRCYMREILAFAYCLNPQGQHKYFEKSITKNKHSLCLCSWLTHLKTSAAMLGHNTQYFEIVLSLFYRQIFIIVRHTHLHQGFLEQPHHRSKQRFHHFPSESDALHLHG